EREQAEDCLEVQSLAERRQRLLEERPRDAHPFECQPLRDDRLQQRREVAPATIPETRPRRIGIGEDERAILSQPCWIVLRTLPHEDAQIPGDLLGGPLQAILRVTLRFGPRQRDAVERPGSPALRLVPRASRQQGLPRL